MPQGYLTLFQNVYAKGVVTHSDIFNRARPVVLSRERAKKVGKLTQDGMTDKDGVAGCRLCHNQLLDGLPAVSQRCSGKVGSFLNAAPYLPHDQNVMFLRHDDSEIMQNHLHIWQLEQIRMMELYFLTSCAVCLGKDFAQKDLTSTDLPRMIFGFNIGPHAGQSLPHVHAQYGWEVVLDRMDISETAISLYYEELTDADLMIHWEHNDLKFRFVAPWTPRGQFAVDIIFTDKYEIHKLDEAECRLFAVLGHKILRKYHELGIKNVNIVFDSSPMARRITPVMAHFIPRVNRPALYELLGRDVVDTPPATIFNHFLNLVPDWSKFIAEVSTYDPDAEYAQAIEGRPKEEK